MKWVHGKHFSKSQIIQIILLPRRNSEDVMHWQKSIIKNWLHQMIAYTSITTNKDPMPNFDGLQNLSLKIDSI